MTDNTLLPFSFPAIRGTKITAAFDGGRITSDGDVINASEKVRIVALRRFRSPHKPLTPPSPPARLDNLEPPGKDTVSIHIHRDSGQRPGTGRHHRNPRHSPEAYDPGGMRADTIARLKILIDDVKPPSCASYAGAAPRSGSMDFTS